MEGGPGAPKLTPQANPLPHTPAAELGTHRGRGREKRVGLRSRPRRGCADGHRRAPDTRKTMATLMTLPARPRRWAWTGARRPEAGAARAFRGTQQQHCRQREADGLGPQTCGLHACQLVLRRPRQAAPAPTAASQLPRVRTGERGLRGYGTTK